LLLAVLAVTGGALLGGVRREDLPWHRPDPLRGTFSFGLMVAGLLLLVGGLGLGGGRRPLARDPIFVVVIAMALIAVWIAPRPASSWTRLTFTLALAWLAFKVYVAH
jgi:hypothetical protein